MTIEKNAFIIQYLNYLKLLIIYIWISLVVKICVFCLYINVNEVNSFRYIFNWKFLIIKKKIKRKIIINGIDIINNLSIYGIQIFCHKFYFVFENIIIPYRKYILSFHHTSYFVKFQLKPITVVNIWFCRYIYSLPVAVIYRFCLLYYNYFH